VIQEPIIITSTNTEQQQHDHHASHQSNSVTPPADDSSSPPPPPQPSSNNKKGGARGHRILRQRMNIKSYNLKRKKRTVAAVAALTPSSTGSSSDSNSGDNSPSQTTTTTTLPTKSFLPLPTREVVGHIRKIQIGGYLIDVWYLAPYPEEYSKLEVLYVCEYCLKYMKSAYIAKRHKVS
jgi:hypothetical protein